MSGVKHSQHWYFNMCCSNSILAGLVQWRSESIENYSSSGGKREARKLEESGQADKKGFTQLKKYLWNKSHHFSRRKKTAENSVSQFTFCPMFLSWTEGGAWWWCGELDVFFWPNRPGRPCRGGDSNIQHQWWDTWEYVTLGKCGWRSIFLPTR